MYEIMLLRHGESEGVERGILQGHLDLPLTAHGKEQILQVARFWRASQQTFDRVLVSPLKRARETAEIVAAELKITQVEVEPDWIERDFGSGEGADLQVIANWYASGKRPTPFEPIYDTGETEWRAHLRAGRAIEKLLSLPEGSYLVVSHGNIINAALHMLMGVLPGGRSLPLEMALGPGCYAKLHYNPATGRWKLLGFNVDACR